MTRREIVLFDKNSEQTIVSFGRLDLQKEYFESQFGRINAMVERENNHEYLVIVDLGTTTIVLQCVHTATAQVMKEIRMLNPQRVYGQDVLSRMQADVNQPGILYAMIYRELDKAVREIMKAVKIDTSNTCVYVSGNTTMLHFLLNLSTEELMQYPFLPVTLEEEKLWLGGCLAFTLPGVSAFVGGDIVAGILATHMHQEKDLQLLIDLGTNGEMVLGNSKRMLSTATAAGPAFETATTQLASELLANGKSHKMLLGTDMISIASRMLQEQVMDETGCLADPYFDEGYEIMGIRILQSDIRRLQMAKAAIRAGVEVLAREYGISLDEISKVSIAGGFGYYLKVEDAMNIGLLPIEIGERCRAIGNSSLEGAYCYALHRMRQNCDGVKMTKSLIANIHNINLAESDIFQDKYIGSMNF